MSYILNLEYIYKKNCRIMNLAMKPEQFYINHVYYCDPIKNNVINDGNFIRIIYSTPLFVLNGINICTILNDIITEKYYNKYKCSFNIHNHKDMIENIKFIEESILKNCNILNKTPQYKIYEQVKNGHIKIFTDIDKDKTNTNLFLLKISGIWINDTQYGITYKFCNVKSSL